MSLVRSLVRQVLALASQQGAATVACVVVRVGEFSGIEPVLFAAAWERSIAGTGASGARLDIEHVPLLARCDACGQRFSPQGFRFVCPHCSNPRVVVTQGEELILESIELSLEEAAERCP